MDVSSTLGMATTLFALPGVSESCDSKAWKQDYFGALFPLNPGGIVPDGPDLSNLIGVAPTSKL